MGTTRRAFDGAIEDCWLDPAEIEPQLVLFAGPARGPALPDSGLAPGDVAAIVVDPGELAGLQAARETASRLSCAVFARNDAKAVIDHGLDGVFLDDRAAILPARTLLGAQRVITVLVPASRHEMMEAGEAGADCLFLDARVAGAEVTAELVSWWSEVFVLPVGVLGIGEPTEAARFCASRCDFIGVDGDTFGHASAILKFVRDTISALAKRESTRPAQR